MTQEQRYALIDRVAAVARNRREVSALGANPYLGIAEALLNAGLIVTPEVEAAVAACKDYYGTDDGDHAVMVAGKALLALENTKSHGPCSACGMEIAGQYVRPWQIGEFAHAGFDIPLCHACMFDVSSSGLRDRFLNILKSVTAKK